MVERRENVVVQARPCASVGNWPAHLIDREAHERNAAGGRPVAETAEGDGVTNSPAAHG